MCSVIIELGVRLQQIILAGPGTLFLYFDFILGFGRLKSLDCRFDIFKGD